MPKRNESYETIGGLFAEITKNSVELSVARKSGPPCQKL